MVVCVLEGPQTRMSVPPMGWLSVYSRAHRQECLCHQWDGCLCTRGLTDKNKNVCATNGMVVCVLEAPQTRMSVPPMGWLSVYSRAHRQECLCHQWDGCLCTRGPTDKNVCATNGMVVCVLEGSQTRIRMSVPPMGWLSVYSRPHRQECLCHQWDGCLCTRGPTDKNVCATNGMVVCVLEGPQTRMSVPP